MEVYLVRLTTPDTLPDLCYGRADVAVAASYEFELAAVRTKLIQAQAKPVLARPTALCAARRRVSVSDGAAGCVVR